MGGSYRFGAIEVRAQERELRVQGERVVLGSRAFDLLVALIERRGRVVSKAELLDAVWPDVVVEENNLAAQIVALRRALGNGAIATIPGRGYQLTLRLDEAAPPSAPRAEAPATNVPAALDRMIAREAELAAILGMLAETRLVQIVGPGGIGKTRLAQEVARSCLDRYPQGACWVDLAAVGSPDRIPSAIATAASVRLAEGESLPQLAGALAKRAMLLVLDNCEHLAADVAFAVSTLMSAADGLRILVTSQEVVRSPGSSVYRLGALAVPPAGTSLDDSRGFGAIRFLEERARSIDPRFALSVETIADAIALCASLDGIPLALEMAAARLPLMGPRALGAHLAQHLEILRNESVHAADRQRTLRAMLEWSHSLLDEDQRRVLRYLAAFVGTFRLDVAQFVACELGLSEVDAIDALAALADKSLVQVESSEPPRYRLLETTRRFAQEELAFRGERGAAWSLHGRAMSRLAEELCERMFDGEGWLAEYLPDYPDLQQASERALARGDVDVFAFTTRALFALDFERDVETDARRRKEAVLSLLPRAGPAARARLLSCLMPYRLIVPAGVDLVEIARELVAAWAALGNRRLHGNALTSLAYHLAGAGRFDEAVATMEEANAVEDAAWPPRLRQRLAQRDAEIGMWCRDERRVRAACERLTRLGSERANPHMGAHPQLILARLALVAGGDDPIPMLGEAVEAIRRVDRPRLLSLALGTLGSACVKAGKLGEARRAIAEAVELQGRLQGTYAFDHLALLAASEGRCVESARVLGYNNAAFASTKRQWPEAWAAERAHELNERALGPQRVQSLGIEGAAMTRADAARLAATLLAPAPKVTEVA